MRKFGLILAALMMFAAAGVQAQVAAPSMNPFLGGANPATLPMQSSSQIGLGYLTVDVRATFGGTDVDLASGEAIGINLSYVGESFAIGYSQLGHDLEIDTAWGGGTITFEESSLNAGARLGESFLIGVGQETAKDTDSTSNETEETQMIVGGGIWKLGDVFYLGGSYGTETSSRSDPLNVESEADHEVTRYGAALYNRDKESGYHFEINRTETTIVELVDPAGNTQYLESYEDTGITLEVIFSNFLIGVQALSSSEETADINNLFTVETLEVSEQVISLGWVPEEGLNIILTIMESEEDNGSGSTINISATGVVVSWAF